MLTPKDKITVINTLDTVLGSGRSMKGNERAHYCPFCHHHKQKLQINLDTQFYHCWVCDAKGRSIVSLLNRLDAPSTSIIKIKAVYKDVSVPSNGRTDTQLRLYLPKEFKPLYELPSSVNPAYNNAVFYLKTRNISLDDIYKYNIGYCETGMYANRVVIPSYDADGELNYFVARSFIRDAHMKYKNPPVSRNVVAFENQINWNEDITLVEGVFDAISVKRNCIPLLGTDILPKLRERILDNKPPAINILLDRDAYKKATVHSEFFINNGIVVRNVTLQDKDPADLRFGRVNQIIKSAKPTGWSDLVKTKLNF